jgi:hypothetical protein
MDNAEFDQLIARAGNPNLIPAIYNYCDRRCDRCPFSARCFNYLEMRRERSAREHEPSSVGSAVARSLERSLDMLHILGRRLGIDLSAAHDAARGDASGALIGKASDDRDHTDQAATDPLVLRARDYTTTTWPILRALRPVVEIRGDAAVLESIDTLDDLCSSVSAKVYRAVWNTTELDFDAAELQSDANGSAKIARLVIDESRRAWRVLMEVGRATADGVPATLVKMLDELDAGVAARFPRAMEFVRPGFDTEPVRATHANLGYVFPDAGGPHRRNA